MQKPTNHYEALVNALTLAITAPTEEKKEQCVAMAEQFAVQLSEVDVARAKKDAKEKAEQFEDDL